MQLHYKEASCASQGCCLFTDLAVLRQMCIFFCQYFSKHFLTVFFPSGIGHFYNCSNHMKEAGRVFFPSTAGEMGQEQFLVATGSAESCLSSGLTKSNCLWAPSANRHQAEPTHLHVHFHLHLHLHVRLHLIYCHLLDLRSGDTFY